MRRSLSRAERRRLPDCLVCAGVGVIIGHIEIITSFPTLAIDDGDGWHDEDHLLRCASCRGTGKRGSWWRSPTPALTYGKGRHTPVS